MTSRTGTAHALWIEAAGRVALRRERLAAPRQDEVEVRARFGAISRGTEALVLAGRVPESEHARMRAPFQEGDFPFPVKYGYACVGEVEAGPGALRGRTVFCLHPHQDRFVVPAERVAVVPEAVPAARAVLAANMETALNVVWDAGIGPGDRVAVVGAGVVGALVARLVTRMPGTDCSLVDIAPERAGLARALGAGFADPAHAPRDCDVVVHASASEAGLATAIDCAGFEARVVEASWYGDGRVAVPLGGAFHSRRLRIVGSQVGHVPTARRARWPYGRRMAAALRLLDDPCLDALVSGESAFAGLADAYPRVLADPATLCHRVVYPGA
ncbi:zinc-dependent alcohol dehydrogenase [Coralloluteibacterium stylophorae]|uniref:Zinc-binding alcohol dehydrogenase n=1 Tax=Coralloluteibacterium stylophorae TaxID=1776034 RepID=A0A8J7VUM5_9GAMM|nr:zinc-binding alcohol dehydrogenase [Coralloluteibacterium stylophorae]MBS7456251.1 zinc-binding alcohol dehydrogenase [Coralloluteibacterium stylophorae]